MCQLRVYYNLAIEIENFLENPDHDAVEDITRVYKDNGILRNECWLVLAGFEKFSVLTDGQQSAVKGRLELDFFT